MYSYNFSPQKSITQFPASIWKLRLKTLAELAASNLTLYEIRKVMMVNTIRRG